VSGSRMPHSDALRMALGSLWSHKLRSFLTMLGVSMAVSTLIAVVALTTGLNTYVAERVGNLGPGVTLFTRTGIITSLKEWQKAKKRKYITMEDYVACRDGLKYSSAVGASAFTGDRVKHANKSLDEVGIRGASPNMVHIRTETVRHGRYISEHDDQHRAMVAFIGHDVAEKLFEGRPAVGKNIWVGGQQLEVIGVAGEQGAVFGNSQDIFVQLPMSTYLKLYGVHKTSIGIYVMARKPELTEQAADEARLLLRARRHVKFDAEDDFGIISASAVQGLWQRLTGSIAAVALGLSAVFLVVGGIVVMNIMLAAVTERTREIGIRKSLGARRSDILRQFLAESAALTTAGGLAGVALALAATRAMSAYTPMPVTMPLTAVVVAVAISSAVGLFFGIYPAAMAAKLDPIVALRAD
jgi:putative ABC transport system permease protein